MAAHILSTSYDAGYEPFPPFGEWPREPVPVEVETLASQLSRAREQDSASFHSALELALRAAAFDTGALEDLYRTNRGLTMSVALQSAAWQAELDQHDADARQFFEAQLAAYELTLDSVTRSTPLSEAWIRRLHEEICGHQETYRVRTEQGVQEQALPKGRYKEHPNHVLEPSGKVFSFAPVAETPHEMQRLVAELTSKDFEAADPLSQASYAHYAFVRIHPFADGNGRVARALASLFLYRAFSVPLVIFADQKTEYLDALKGADRGGYEALVAFVRDRTRDALSLSARRLAPE